MVRLLLFVNWPFNLIQFFWLLGTILKCVLPLGIVYIITIIFWSRAVFALGEIFEDYKNKQENSDKNSIVLRSNLVSCAGCIKSLKDDMETLSIILKNLITIKV